MKPTVHLLTYITLAGSAAAQAERRARECEHEWRDLEEGEDQGIDFIMIQDGQLGEIRPCARCDAAQINIAGIDGGSYGLVALRNLAQLTAPE